jgi:hypothetical protein
MKTIKVFVERWLEVPDEWELHEPNFTGQLHLKTDGGDLIPELTWMKLKDHSEETCGWEEVGSDFKDSIGNMMTAGASSVEFVDDERDEEGNDV